MGSIKDGTKEGNKEEGSCQEGPRQEEGTSSQEEDRQEGTSQEEDRQEEVGTQEEGHRQEEGHQEEVGTQEEGHQEEDRQEVSCLSHARKSGKQACLIQTRSAIRWCNSRTAGAWSG